MGKQPDICYEGEEDSTIRIFDEVSPKLEKTEGVLDLALFLGGRG